MIAVQAMPDSRSVPISQVWRSRCLVHLVVRQRVDDTVPGDLPHDEQEHADDDERRADVSQRLSAPPLRDVDGEREQYEDGKREEDRERAQDLDALLRGIELVRVHDHDLAGVGPEPLLETPAEADLVAELLDQRPEVEHDVAVRRRQAVRMAVDDGDQLLVSPAVRLLPEGLDARTR